MAATHRGGYRIRRTGRLVRRARPSTSGRTMTAFDSDADLHRDVAAALHFPDYYGNNLDALNDCMRDVVDQEYGWSPDATGLVLVFTGYDAYATRRPGSAHSVLDILADRSRDALLFG